MKKKEKEVKKARPTIKDCNFQIELLANNVNWAFRKIKELEEKIEELEKTEAEYKPAWNAISWISTDLKKTRDRKPLWRFW